MRERAVLIDGKIEIESGPQGGTVVKLQTPR
jgi:signal transduction histidine kinase